MATTLQSLPSELQREKIKHISLPYLLDLRLVSLHFCDLAADYAFEKKSLATDLETIGTFIKVPISDRLRGPVRDLTVDISFKFYDVVSDVLEVSII